VNVLHDGVIHAPWKKEIDLSGQAKGIYIIRLAVDGVSTHRKISIL
jgi:hypothetical protein